MASRVALDAHGDAIDIDPEALPSGPAILVVSPVEDAVKEVSGDRVQGGRDRANLGFIEALIIDAALYARLRDDVGEDDWIEAVRNAGVEWVVVSRSASGP